MRISEFIHKYNLQPADAIAVKKDVSGLRDHYLLYLGEDYWGEHLFMANYTSGTRILSQQELMPFANSMQPVKIAKFQGSEYEREDALDRAFELNDRDSYQVILNNCKHLKKYVEVEKPFSNHTKAFGQGLAAAGITAMAASKSKEGKTAGVILAGLGLLTLFLESQDD